MDDATFTDLPLEIWCMIFSWLSGPSVCNAALACRFFHQLTKSEYLWEMLCRSIGQTSLLPADPVVKDNSKNLDEKEKEKEKEEEPAAIDQGPSWRSTYIKAHYSHVKPLTSWAVFGPPHSGKSALVGRLLAMKKKSGGDDGVESDLTKYIAMTDTLPSERISGHTEESHVAYVEDEQRSMAFISLPGDMKKKNIRAFYHGASLADSGLVVISPDSTLPPQVLRALLTETLGMARSLGLKSIVVAVNKCDLNNWDEPGFYSMKDKIENRARAVMYNPKTIPVVPISCKTGDNILDWRISEKPSWYHGPTLWDALAKVPEPIRNVKAPLRFSVNKHYKARGRSRVGPVLEGRVMTGCLFENQRVMILPPMVGLTTQSYTSSAPVPLRVATIQKDGKPVGKAIPGDIVGISLRFEDKEHEGWSDRYPRRGTLVIPFCDTELRSGRVQGIYPTFSSILVKIVMLGDDIRLRRGSELLLVSGTAEMPVRVVQLVAIHSALGKKEKVEDNPSEIRRSNRHTAQVVLCPIYQSRREARESWGHSFRRVRYDFPRAYAWKDTHLRIPPDIYFEETFKGTHNTLGGFGLIHSNRGVAVGVVEEFNPKVPAELASWFTVKWATKQTDPSKKRWGTWIPRPGRK